MRSEFVELRWRARGSLPPDYGYRLFSAICHRLPARIHREDRAWTMSPVLDTGGGAAVVGRIEDGEVRIRCAMRLLPDFLDLHAPQGLAVGEGHVLLSPAPTIHPIVPRASLSSPLVILCADSGAPRRSRDEFRRQLGARLAESFGVQAVLAPPGATAHVGVAARVSIRGDLSHGYAVELRGLDPVASLRLQELGLGGRRRMGCGFMVGE